MYTILSSHKPFLNFRFQIPFTVQNNKVEDISKLRNEWLMIIDRYCSLPKDGSVSQDNASEAEYEKIKNPCLSEGKMEKSAGLPVDSPADSLVVTPPSSCLGSVMTQLLVKTTIVETPPPVPKSSIQPLASSRTKIFHWDVVPQEKV